MCGGAAQRSADKTTAAQLTFASPHPAMKQELWVGEGGKEHLCTIEMEEEYVQSLVTGALHRATQRLTQWPCVCGPRHGLAHTLCIQKAVFTTHPERLDLLLVIQHYKTHLWTKPQI